MCMKSFLRTGILAFGIMSLLLSCKTRTFGPRQESTAFSLENEPCVLDGTPSFQAGLKDVRLALDQLWDAKTPKEQKEMAIAQAFKSLDALCDTDCDKVLDFLKIANEKSQSKEFKTLIDEKLGPLAQTAGVTPDHIKVMQDGLQKLTGFFETRGTQAFTLRAKATLEFMRLIITSNEEMMIALTESKEVDLLQRFKQDAEFQNYINSLLRQGRALLLLAEVAAKFSKTEGYKLTENDARNIANAIGDIGFFYAKWVQSMSNLTATLDLEDGVMAHFQKFQENLDPMPWSDVESVFLLPSKEGGLEKRPHELFIIPGYSPGGPAPKPLAVATIGQTYKWRLKTSFGGERDVIVKVQKIGRAAELKKSSELNQAFLKLKDIAVAGESFAPIVDLIFTFLIGFEKSVGKELDFRYELKNLERARAYLGTQAGVHIPEPILNYSSEKILTMELAPGINIEKILKGKGDEFMPGAREETFASLIDSVAFQFLAMNRLHGDMHPGNVMASGDGELSLIDWANEFPTKGLIWEPIGFATAFFFGNHKGVAKSLDKLKTSDGFRTEDFAAFVRVEMDKIGLKEIKVTDLVKAEDGSRQNAAQLAHARMKRFEHEDEFVGKFFATLGNIIKSAIRPYGWVPTERYANLLRTSLPIVATAGSFAAKTENAHMWPILKHRAIRLVPLWVFRKAIGGGLYRDALFRRPVVAFLEGAIDSAAKNIQKCQLFKSGLKLANTKSQEPELTAASLDWDPENPKDETLD